MRKLELLKKLKNLNEEYCKVDENRKGEIFNESNSVIEELKSLGVAKSWSEAVLCFGDDFTFREYGLSFSKLINIFDNKSNL